MFGRGLFDDSGGDVNAGSLGTDENSFGNGGGGYGSNDYSGQDNQNYHSDFTQDPAAQAAHDAEQGLKKEESGQGVAGAIGKTSGLFSSIYGMFDARAKRLRKRQRLFARAQAANQLDTAKRNVAQYEADSEIQAQKLQQSYAGRGIGESSIQTEGMNYFSQTRERTRESLAQQVALSQLNQNLVRSQISMSYANTWLSFGDSVASLF